MTVTQAFFPTLFGVQTVPAIISYDFHDMGCGGQFRLGELTMAGVAASEAARYCALGSPCTLALSGVGLRATNAVTETAGKALTGTI